MSKAQSLALTIILILTVVQNGYSETIIYKNKKYIDSFSHNKLVDDYNIQYDLLVESRDKLKLAQKNLHAVTKLKCPPQTKNKIIVGSICVTIGLVLGFGIGFGIAYK